MRPENSHSMSRTWQVYSTGDHPLRDHPLRWAELGASSRARTLSQRLATALRSARRWLGGQKAQSVPDLTQSAGLAAQARAGYRWQFWR